MPTFVPAVKQAPASNGVTGIVFDMIIFIILPKDRECQLRKDFESALQMNVNSEFASTGVLF